MGEQHPTPSAAPKSLDPEREERINADCPQTPSCNEKLLPRYLRPLQGSCHDLCKTQRKMDTISPLNFLTSNENILSRYLTPSQGSCHDMCKYGHKHESEEATRKHPFFSRVFGNNQNEEHNQMNFTTVKHRQKSDFMSVLNQKSEIKSKTSQTKEQIHDKLKLNEEMDLPPDKIIMTSNPIINLAEGSVEAPSSLELSSPINDQNIIASLGKSIENGIGRHELVNTETVLVHTPIAMELERAAIQNEFSFHNDALITEVGKSAKKIIDLKSMVSSTAEGETDSEYERENPSELFSVENTSIELIFPTPFRDDIAPGEFQTSNGEEESYNKLIDSMMETVNQSPKEPSSLKLKNYRSKESAKQRPSHEELASKRALGTNLKRPLELERTAIQKEFLFPTDAVITEVGKSAKKLIDLNLVVSSIAKGKIDSEYERANPSEVFSVEHTSMELIPPTPFTDDIVASECQTSNGEEESYNKPIGNMMETVHQSSKELSSLKLKNYKSKESAKQRPSHKELASKQALGTNLKTLLELERTATQKEFSFHNDAVITEVGKSSKKLIDLKSMVSSTAKGKTDSEYERVNPSEVSSVEHTSMELVPPTPFTDEIVLSECRTPNGEEESYNKPIDDMIRTIDRSPKELSSLKLKSYKSKESPKQRPIHEELAYKQSLGMEPERTAIQNEFSFHNDVAIAEVGESPKKLIDFMVSPTLKGNTDSEYERANPSEVFLVEHTSMELIPPTPITDDIVPGECQTSNGEEESYSKPIDSKMGTVHGSSKELSSLKLKSYKSKESTKQRPSRKELASKQALGTNMKTLLKLERTTIQKEFSFHNDAVITEVGKSSKKLIDLKSMVSSTAKGKTNLEYERVNPSEVSSVEHTSMELVPPTPFTDEIVPSECQTSNGEEESYNKPIDNMIITVERSSKELSNLKSKSYKSKESAKQRPIHEELASKQALGMEPERTAIQNEFSFLNDAAITEVGESPKKLIDFMVSSTLEGNTDSEYERTNPSEVFSVDHTSMELIPRTPITDDIVLGECQTSNGEEESYSKPIDSKMETIHGLSKEPSNLTLKKYKSKESAKQRPSHKELASIRALGMRPKAPLIQKTHTFNISTPQASFSLKHIHLKSLSIHDKKKREQNKPKIQIKEIGDTRRHKVVELQRYASDGPNVVKVNSALKKAIKVVKSESDHDNPSIACGTVRFVTPKVIINSISRPSKSNNRATKAVAYFRKKEVLETSSPPCIYSKGVSGQRKQEKEKIIKVADNLQNVAKEVIEPLSNPSSRKPQFTRVPSIKLRKNMTIAPSFTMNNQAKARTTFVKGKSTRANEPNLEKIDLKALRQKLRKLGSFSNGKKEHAASGSQRSGGNEPFWLKEVSQAWRTYRDVPKVERRSRSRKASFDSEDKVGLSPKLNFSRGKDTNLQPNNCSPPARLTFRRAKTVGDNQNAKISPTRSFRNWMKSDVGGTSTSPSKSIKVVLRHKHAGDKKVEKSLLNHVIEETASKLVESRKSKVKALVGAFETVISLQ